MTVNASGTQPRLSEQVAEEIRALLGRRRMSGRELARRMGASPSWVNFRLTGAQPINLDDLQRFADALEVDAMDLFPRGLDGRLIPAASPQADHRTGTNARSSRPAERPNLSGQRQRADERESTRRPARRTPILAERMPDDLMAELVGARAA